MMYDTGKMSSPPVRCSGPNTICFVSRMLDAIRHTVKMMLNCMNSTDTIVFFFLILSIRNNISSPPHKVIFSGTNLKMIFGDA